MKHATCLTRAAARAALAALALGLMPLAQAQAPIRIGILTELSGPLGPSGAGERDGFTLYLKNHGNRLAGREVQLIIEDTAGDPQVAITKAKKLAESDRIDVLIGPLLSANGAALKGYLVGQHLPTLLEATVDEVTDGKYIFRTSFSGNADSYLEGYLPGKAGFRRALIVAPNFNAGQTAAEYFDKGFRDAGGTVVQKLLPRLGAPDFGATIAQFSDQADVGIIFMAGGDAIRFVKAFSSYGKKLPLYGFTATVDETLLPTQGKAALGFTGAGFYFSTIDSAANRQFVSEYKAAYNKKPAWFSAGGYIAGQALEAALVATGGRVDDREALVAALKAVQLTTPAGPFRFDANNNPIQPRYVMQIREVNGVIEPVVLGVIPEFKPLAEPPTLPAGLVLPH
jgi:branched-chain amino acid transport system substrate-binding protein